MASKASLIEAAGLQDAAQVVQDLTFRLETFLPSLPVWLDALWNKQFLRTDVAQ